MADALVYPEIFGQGAAQPKSLVGAPGNDLFNDTGGFYNACKHGRKLQ